MEGMEGRALSPRLAAAVALLCLKAQHNDPKTSRIPGGTEGICDHLESILAVLFLLVLSKQTPAIPWWEAQLLPPKQAHQGAPWHTPGSKAKVSFISFPSINHK